MVRLRHKVVSARLSTSREDIGDGRPVGEPEQDDSPNRYTRDNPGLNQIRVYLVQPGAELPAGAFRKSSGREYVSRSTHTACAAISPLRHHQRVDRIGSRFSKRSSAVRFHAEAMSPHFGGATARARGEDLRADIRIWTASARSDALEPDFGLRTAAGLIDPAAIAECRLTRSEATVLQVRRQSSRGTGTRGIGLDVGREMLRAIAGELLDESIRYSEVTGSGLAGLDRGTLPDLTRA